MQAQPARIASLGAIMHELAQQIVSGLATGSVFAFITVLAALGIGVALERLVIRPRRDQDRWPHRRERDHHDHLS
jgi:branched-subunit amino acid ABC-type transport system permease component